MPDAIPNGNIAPYLAQAFTPQGVGPQGLGNQQLYGGWQQQNPFGQSPYQPPYGGWQQPNPLGQSPYQQPYGGWQQPNPFGQLPYQQLYGGWQQQNPLYQLAMGGLGVGITGTYGQGHQHLHHIVQAADLIARVQAGDMVARMLPYLPQHIAQSVDLVARVQAADLVARVLPIISTTHGQGWLGQQQGFGQQLGSQFGWQPQWFQQSAMTPFGGGFAGQYGAGQTGPLAGQGGDSMTRILPFLAQQGLAGPSLGVGYGMRI